MARVRVEDLTVKYGGVTAVDDVSFAVEEGQFVALLGPSGCGKTSSLRALAGLEPISGGRITIGNRTVAEGNRQLSPDKRGVNMVFQSYAIWPHLTVFDNVAYGLKVRRQKKADIERAVMDILGTVGLAAYRDRFGTELSGGQQQRVAVARAVVTEPDVLLFDEPLSNLDAALRTRMRVELRDLQQSIGKTAIYVTHDQQEAMAIADKIILMNQGRIEQEGSGEDLYARPRTAFVAEFIGVANLWNGQVSDVVPGRGYQVRLDDGRDCGTSFGGHEGLQRGDRVTAVARPEDFEIHVGAADGIASENYWPATVSNRTYLGNQVDMLLEMGKTEVHIETSPHTAARAGDQVVLWMDPQRLVCVPESSHAARDAVLT